MKNFSSGSLQIQGVLGLCLLSVHSAFSPSSDGLYILDLSSVNALLRPITVGLLMALSVTRTEALSSSDSKCHQNTENVDSCIQETDKIVYELKTNFQMLAIYTVSTERSPIFIKEIQIPHTYSFQKVTGW